MISLAHPEVTQSRQPFILALDVGTSSVRASLFDATGAAVPHIRAQHSYKLTTSNEGEVSVDADMLVETVAKSVDDDACSCRSFGSANRRRSYRHLLA